MGHRRTLRPPPNQRLRVQGHAPGSFSRSAASRGPQHKGRSHKSHKLRPPEAPPTRFGARPGYLQLLCSEGRPRAFGWLGLTVLFRGHCPLQRETVPWGATEAADHASPSLLVAAWKGRGGGSLSLEGSGASGWEWGSQGPSPRAQSFLSILSPIFFF